MKKKLFHALCTVLAIILILMSVGCGSGEKDADHTVETYSEIQTVYGTVIETNPDDGTLVIKVDYDCREICGMFARIRTNYVKMFKLFDNIYVSFNTVEHSDNSLEPITVISLDIGFANFSDNADEMMDKPVIYLYPEAPTECSVTLELNGELTCTYPDYGENGWQSFTAYPDGTLVFPDGKEYYCLFWEGKTYTDFELSEGFCVRGEDTEKFLEYALSALGLTPREANEFIIYWLPIMQHNEYNVITFQTDRYTDAAKLEITPTPDSILRVFMTFKASESYVELPPQTFEGFTREGFTVVEWGGTELK